MCEKDPAAGLVATIQALALPGLEEAPGASVVWRAGSRAPDLPDSFFAPALLTRFCESWMRENRTSRLKALSGRESCNFRRNTWHWRDCTRPQTGLGFSFTANLTISACTSKGSSCDRRGNGPSSLARAASPGVPSVPRMPAAPGDRVVAHPGLLRRRVGPGC
jgi:hypothetical protein